MTPTPAWLVLSGWHGATAYEVFIVGMTPHRFRIAALKRTRLQGRNRWLEVGATALVSKSAVRVAQRCVTDDERRQLSRASTGETRDG